MCTENLLLKTSLRCYFLSRAGLGAEFVGLFCHISFMSCQVESAYCMPSITSCNILLLAHPLILPKTLQCSPGFEFLLGIAGTNAVSVLVSLCLTHAAYFTLPGTTDCFAWHAGVLRTATERKRERASKKARLSLLALNSSSSVLRI